MYRLLAASVETLHALSMLLWALGLPLLVWHRFRRLSVAYMFFSAAFVAISVVSHLLLGECLLTIAARNLWLLGGGYRDGVPFTAQLANAIAGIHPTQREVVLVWEAAVVVTSLGNIWCWRKTRGSAVPTRISARSTGHGLRSR